jgi:transglutaminase-like putative cysteine protease
MKRAPPPPSPAITRLTPRFALRLTRDKSDTLLLLAAALMVLAPHFEHLPPWISIGVCATLLWRAAITWLGKRMPPIWLLLPISVAAMGGVYRTYHTLLGRDAGVAMLALLLAFKLLEMRARRDLFVVVFLSFFVLLTNFFYSQSMPTALFMVATLIVLLTAQQSFQYTGTVPPLAARLRTSARIFLLAAPLAMLLFVGFPRIQGPLWGLPGDAHAGKTGISDSMAPGTLSSLAQSEEVAFRVRFIDPRPAQNQLYWRSIVLGDYDGRTWTRVPRRRGMQRLEVTINARGKPVRHEITMEATGKRWLALLELAGPDQRVPGYLVRDSDEMEAFTTDPVGQRVRFSASAYLDYQLQAGERPERMRRWLELPAGFNPRTLALAGQLKQAAPDAGAAQLAQTVLTRFRTERYNYTLEPPLLGRDAVDDFLFNSKAGFCEHYAGAFVVLMRAMGVPARVVTGYQGGEMNPVDGFLTVRQSDAHAWAEIWTAGAGWTRVDPTSAVAPERVSQNLARALPKPAPFGLGPLMDLQNDPDSWLAQLRFGYAAMNNSWNQWVLDYNPDRQRSFLEELGAAFGNWRSALGAALIGVLLLTLRWRRQQRPADPLEALYQLFCRQQARHGYTRQADEGPQSYAMRLARMPASQEKHAAMDKFLNLYGTLKYGAAAPDTRSASLTMLKTLLPLCR